MMNMNSAEDQLLRALLLSQPQTPSQFLRDQSSPRQNSQSFFPSQANFSPQHQDQLYNSFSPSSNMPSLPPLSIQGSSEYMNLNFLLEMQGRRPTSLAMPMPFSSTLQGCDIIRQQQHLSNLSNSLSGAAPVAAAARGKPRGSRRLPVSEREHFFVFIKILFKCLDQVGDVRLRQRAKAVVTDCTRRNRMGDINYHPLQEAIELRLRSAVGEVHWARAKLAFDSANKSSNNGNITKGVTGVQRIAIV